jgi:hypothetical protein
MSNPNTPQGESYPNQEAAAPVEQAAEQAPAPQPEAPAAKRWQLPRWAASVIAVPTALAVIAAGAYALDIGGTRGKINSVFNSAFGAGNEEDARRTRVVGLQLDLDGVSKENIAAITSGNNSVISALRGKLADAYTDTDFDFYYSQPKSDGNGKEYVIFPADAEEDNADEQPKDTITLPMSGINGTITPENMDEVVSGLWGQITPQLDE